MVCRTPDAPRKQLRGIAKRYRAVVAKENKTEVTNSINDVERLVTVPKIDAAMLTQELHMQVKVSCAR